MHLLPHHTTFPDLPERQIVQRCGQMQRLDAVVGDGGTSAHTGRLRGHPRRYPASVVAEERHPGRFKGA